MLVASGDAGTRQQLLAARPGDTFAAHHAARPAVRLHRTPSGAFAAWACGGAWHLIIDYRVLADGASGVSRSLPVLAVHGRGNLWKVAENESVLTVEF